MDRRDLCQLLADAGRAGISSADAVVVHLLEKGEGGDTLMARGSSNIDITSLGKTLMRKGEGIAGHAIEERVTINVPDVSKDPRYCRLPASFETFTSLMTAPMYVGDTDIGTISVNSSIPNAFGKRDERFLTTLGAQGAMALANVDFRRSNHRRRQLLGDILQASRGFRVNEPLERLAEIIASEVCSCTGFRMAVVNLMDETGWEVVVAGMHGLPPEGVRQLADQRIPVELMRRLLGSEHKISESYYIRHDRRPDVGGLERYLFTPTLQEQRSGGWHPDDILIIPMRTKEQEFLGYLSVDDPADGDSPTFESVQALELLASLAATAIENAQLYQQAQKEIAVRKQAEESLAREQHMLQTFMDNVDEHIYFKDLDSRFVRINRALADWFGLTDPSEAVGKTDADFFTQAHAQQALEDEQRVIRTGRMSHRAVEEETWTNGRRTWVTTTKLPWYDEHGRIQGTYGFSRDITEKVRQDQRRQECQSAVMNSVTQFTSLEGLAEYIVQTGTRFIEAQDCTLFLDIEENGTLSPVATTAQPGGAEAHGISALSVWDLDHQGLHAGRSERLAGRALRDHPVWSRRLCLEPPEDARAEHLRSLLTVPLMKRGRGCIGLLVARNSQQDSGFTEFDEELIRTLADHAVSSVDRIQDVEERFTVERARLETELHAAMNMLATGVKWEAEIAMDELDEGRPQEASKALQRLFDAYTGAYIELSYVLDDLHDPTLEREGVIAALEKKAALIAPGHTRIICDVDDRLPPEMEGDLYRIGIEGMNNAAKHAGIKQDPQGQVLVLLERCGHQIRLWVVDNGTGFAAAARTHTTGWGLRRLEEIVRGQDGQLVLSSRPGQGTTLCALMRHNGSHSRDGG